MFLSDLSIRRPVLATMLSLALVLFGVIGYRQLTIREYPDVDPPIVSVSVFLRGANPRVIESAVTDVLEEELSSAEGVRTMTSVSSEQSSTVTLESMWIVTEIRSHSPARASSIELSTTS